MNGTHTPTDPVSTGAGAELPRMGRLLRAHVPLEAQSARAGFLMIVSHVAQLAIGIVAVAVLARLVAPADFGLVAMVGVLLGFVDILKGFSFAMAIVQRAEITHEQVSVLFWLNLKLGVPVAVFMAAMGPVLAWFFQQPSLIIITPVLAGGVALAGVSDLHQGLLRRELRFGTIALIHILSTLIGAGVGISFALLGWGYWALVHQQFATFLVLAGLPWFFSRWRPAWNARSEHLATDEGLRSMVVYGKELSFSKIVTHLGRNLDFLLIGRFAGPGALGLYQTAFRWAMLPVQELYLPLLSVAVASFSRVRQDVDRYRHGFRIAIGSISMFVFPTLGFLFVAAPDVILLLLGPQWLDAVAIFQALLVAAFFDSGRLSTKWIYLIEGQTKRQLRWTLLSTPVMVLGVGTGVAWGAFGVAVGYSAAVVLLMYPAVAYCLTTSPVRARDFWGAVWRPAFAAIFAAALLTTVNLFGPLSLSLLPRLAVYAGSFTSAYLVIWLFIPGGKDAMREVLGTIQSLLGFIAWRDPHAPAFLAGGSRSGVGQR
jgi:O-antigen/teichoic acid export membrane protein